MVSILVQETANRVALLVEKYSSVKGEEIDVFNEVHAEIQSSLEHQSFDCRFDLLNRVTDVLWRKGEALSWGTLMCPVATWAMWDAYTGSQDFFDTNVPISELEQQENLSDTIEAVLVTGINKDMTEIVEFLTSDYGDMNLINAVREAWDAATQIAKETGWDMQAPR